MDRAIWLMEGLSSQRDIISDIKDFIKSTRKTVTIIASHRHHRNEILSLADTVPTEAYISHPI